MSICRRGDSGGIYLYECATERPLFHCQICTITDHPWGDWFGRSRWAVVRHLLAHKWRERGRVRVWFAILNAVWYRT